MQTIGFVSFWAVGVATITILSVSLYSALPKALLAYAEAHGRFQGLPHGQKMANGTRAGNPPAGRPLVLSYRSI
jgi:hypothetical protein